MRELADCLERFGLDLVHGFDASSYNRRIDDRSILAPLPLFGRERALGIVVGNTRALWAPFSRSYRSQAHLRSSDNPLDTYVTESIEHCLAQVPQRTSVHFAHERGRRLVSMLALSDASGLAHLGPAHLAIHPTHGPWLALRAVIVVDADPPVSPERAPDVCRGCDAPCVDALAVASNHVQETTEQSMRSSWPAWLAVRDACPIGRGSRYGEAQIRYHYTKNRAAIDD